MFIQMKFLMWSVTNVGCETTNVGSLATYVTSSLSKQSNIFFSQNTYCKKLIELHRILFNNKIKRNIE